MTCTQKPSFFLAQGQANQCISLSKMFACPGQSDKSLMSSSLFLGQGYLQTRQHVQTINDFDDTQSHDFLCLIECPISFD